QVEIPAESVEAFLDEHLEAERGPELVLPDEFRFERVTTKPQPWLLRRFPEHGQQVWGRLELQYGSRRVSVPHHPPVVVDVAERRMHVHEPGTEHRLAKRLLAIGFQGAGHPDDAHEPMPLPDGTLVNISATE